MSYYTPLNVETLPAIQDAVLERIPDYLFNETNLTYLENNRALFLGIPELEDLLSKLGVMDKVLTIAVNVTLPHKSGNIHVDGGSYQHSLNIPIVGCKNTWVKFYSSKEEPKQITLTNSTGTHTFLKYDESVCDEILTVEATGPYIMDTKVPHKVVNTTDNIRVMLLIRLDRTFKITG